MYMKFYDPDGNGLGSLDLDDCFKNKIDEMSEDYFDRFYSKTAETLTALTSEKNKIEAIRAETKASIVKSEADVRKVISNNERSVKNVSTLFENIPKILDKGIPLLKMALGMFDENVDSNDIEDRFADVDIPFPGETVEDVEQYYKEHPKSS